MILKIEKVSRNFDGVMAMARALVLQPRLLLLDEPTAGMNPTETTEMLEFISILKTRGLTILLIEHKLTLVMQLSDRVVVMDDGRKIAEGAPDVVRNGARDMFISTEPRSQARPHRKS